MNKKKSTWCYSYDGDDFQGEFDTKNDAIEGAKYDIEMGNCEYLFYYIGQVQDAEYFLDTLSLGHSICENIEDQLDGYIAADSPIIELTNEEMNTLGKIVIDYIKGKSGFKIYNVDDIEKYKFEGNFNV